MSYLTKYNQFVANKISKFLLEVKYFFRKSDVCVRTESILLNKLQSRLSKVLRRVRL